MPCYLKQQRICVRVLTTLRSQHKAVFWLLSAGSSWREFGLSVRPSGFPCPRRRLPKRDIRFAQVSDSASLLGSWALKKQEESQITRRICWSLRIGFERTRIAVFTWKGFAGRRVFVVHGVVTMQAGRPVARDYGSVRRAITKPQSRPARFSTRRESHCGFGSSPCA